MRKKATKKKRAQKLKLPKLITGLMIVTMPGGIKLYGSGVVDITEGSYLDRRMSKVKKTYSAYVRMEVRGFTVKDEQNGS